MTDTTVPTEALTKEAIDAKVKAAMEAAKPATIETPPVSPEDKLAPFEEGWAPGTTKATVSYSRMWTKSGVLIDSEDAEELVTIPQPPDVPMASVGYSCGMTVNLGDYESVKMTVSVTLPAPCLEVADAFEAARKFVNTRLGLEVKAVKDHRTKRAETRGTR